MVVLALSGHSTERDRVPSPPPFGGHHRTKAQALSGHHAERALETRPSSSFGGGGLVRGDAGPSWTVRGAEPLARSPYTGYRLSAPATTLLCRRRASLRDPPTPTCSWRTYRRRRTACRRGPFLDTTLRRLWACPSPQERRPTHEVKVLQAPTNGPAST